MSRPETTFERVLFRLDRRNARRPDTGRRALDRLRPQPRNREWMTTEEAVAYLGLPSRKALYQAVRRGQVPVHRFGLRRMRFKRAELAALLDGGRR